MIPVHYVSTAVINTSEEKLIDSIQTVESRQSLTQLIVQEGLYPSERGRMPIEDIVEEMKHKDIVIRLIGGQAFAVSFSSADAAQAQRITERLAAQLGTVVDPAKLPVVPVAPLYSKIMFIGLIAGIVLGSLVALFAGLKVWKLAAGLAKTQVSSRHAWARALQARQRMAPPHKHVTMGMKTRAGLSGGGEAAFYCRGLKRLQ